MNKRLLIPKRVAHRTPPENLRSEDSWLFQREYEREIKASELFVFDHIEIAGQDLFGHSGVMRLIYPKGASKKDLLLRSSKRLLPARKTIAEGVWITDNWSYGYFHWLLDCLPRLLVAEDQLPANCKVLLPQRLSAYSFVGDSLEMLGFDYEFVPNTSKLHVDRLWIPEQLAPSGNYVEEGLDLLRKKLMIRSDNPGRRIYISRQHSRRRLIANVEEVEKTLDEYCFESVFMEDLPFSEQLKLSSESAVICGLHGAGLANILFASSQTKVLEFRREGDDWNNCHFSLAACLGMPYYYLTGHGSSKDTHLADVSINIGQLRKVLELVCQDPKPDTRPRQRTKTRDQSLS